MKRALCHLVSLLFGVQTLVGSVPISVAEQLSEERKAGMESIVVGGGCFWCVEAVFQQFEGVVKVTSGYAGGEVENPSYESIGNGDTGHAEVVEVQFDTKKLSTEQLLTIFFHAHDPTTKDRQGADVGSQYRSIILFGNEEQKRIAELVIQKVKDAKLWGDAPIVTELDSLKKFYSAEEYHQNYFNLNGSKPYCSFVIAPKVAKIRKEFKELLRK